MKTVFTYICILLLVSYSAFSQSHDSLATLLKHKIEKAITDSARIGYKVELIKQMHRFDLDTTRMIINDVLQHIEKIKNPEQYHQKNKTYALNYLGIIDNKQGDSENALTHYLEALDICDAIQDSATI